jgi:hypothetical protein
MTRKSRKGEKDNEIKDKVPKDISRNLASESSATAHHESHHDICQAHEEGGWRGVQIGQGPCWLYRPV